MWSQILLFLLRRIIALRYSINVSGLNEVIKKVKQSKTGVLWCPNHPALIDPVIIFSLLRKKISLRAIVIDYIFYNKWIRPLLRSNKSFLMPNFAMGSNSYKEHKVDECLKQVKYALLGGQNILIYPSGRLKLNSKEIIGGASASYQLLQECPNTMLVLVRTVGLWGSRFSSAYKGKTPDIVETFTCAFKSLLKNLIFFAPKREVNITFEILDTGKLKTINKQEFNQTLEQWYNKPFKGEGEPLILVPNTFWSRKVKKISDKHQAINFSIESIPTEVKQDILEEIARISNQEVKNISVDDYLEKDIGLDSLDMSRLILFISKRFNLSRIYPEHLNRASVLKVMGIACGLIVLEEFQPDQLLPKDQWLKKKRSLEPSFEASETLLEAFLQQADKRSDEPILFDDTLGELNYKQARKYIIRLAVCIKELGSERHIGIMLPASSSSVLCVLACYLLGKVPVMVNWTVGPKALKGVVELAKVTHVISSWKFVDQLASVDFGVLSDKLVFLEEFKFNMNLRKKWNILKHLPKSTQALIKSFPNASQSKQDHAVILFTSGSEGLPKAVPLSHYNILENLKFSFLAIQLKKEDILMGFLPPFHSFGFSITSLFPIITGVRVTHYPNPLNGKYIAKRIKERQASILCAAPSFLDNLLNESVKEDLISLRVVVSGAEKPSQHLKDYFNGLNDTIAFIEGYGITECSPVITLNPLNEEPRGVGKALRNLTIKIVNPNDFSPVSTNEQGLIIVSGPSVFGGYLGHPSKSSVFLHLEDKTWYNTGDLGLLDKMGCLHITGRLKRFIKISGEMISLPAIEKELKQLLEPDQDLAVVADEEPGKKSRIILFSNKEMKVKEVNNVLSQSGYSNLVKISHFVLLGEIPMTGTGKIDYPQLNHLI